MSSTNGAHKFKPKERTEEFTRVQDYIQGAEDTKSVYDFFEDLELTDLKQKVEKKIKSTLKDRTELHFELALYRDLRYAARGSKYCWGILGTVNNLRELYEGKRIMHPSQDDPDY